MYDQNKCLFIPYHKDYHSIHTINLVFETKPQSYSTLKSEAVYKMYYVCSGTGYLHTPGQIQPLSAGDVFFTFPATPFCLESVENFTYMYISFLGTRGNMIMEKLGISGSHFLFHDCGEIYAFWETGLLANPELTDLMSESILLYTFTFLGNRILSLQNTKNKSDDTVSVIKKYIDDNFSNVAFSLEDMSDQLQYNKKYLSAVFKRKMNVGIIEYLNTIRIQHACTMVQQGFTSVNDIALRCGYSDPQYFSKLFKSKMGMSPAAYIKTVSASVTP